MSSAADLDLGPARVLIEGYPGSGKTGSIACLANAGFKIRVLSFDKRANMAPLIRYTKPEMRSNIDIIFFEDKMRVAPNGQTEPAGIPTAYYDAHKALDRWISIAPDGTQTDLGRSKDWRMDTILLMDNTTSMSTAAMNRASKMGNFRDRRKVYDIAQQEYSAFLDMMVSSSRQHHTIVLSHLVMVGPKEIEDKDDQVNKEIKTEIAELLPTRLYPTSPGKALSDKIGGKFSTTLLAETKAVKGRIKRVLNYEPRLEIDLKAPVGLNELPSDLPIEDGMLKVFEAITPGIAACLADKTPVPESKE